VLHLRCSFGILTLMTVSAFGSVAQATTIDALSLEELVREASVILVAEVDSSESLYDARGRIVTDHALRVHDVWRGDAPARPRVRVLGGVIGEVGMRVPGEPALRQGERYLLFLRRGADPTVWRPVGMGQGVMKIEASPGGAMVMPGGEGARLVQRDARGALRPAPPALIQPEPLAALRARVSTLSRAR